MAGIPFVPRIDDAPHGVLEQVSPRVQRIICANPSKFTYRGTGTYIIGGDRVVVIDPGPRMDSHRDAIAAALRGRECAGIIITHCHGDHSPLSAWLKEETGATAAIHCADLSQGDGVESLRPLATTVDVLVKNARAMDR